MSNKGFSATQYRLTVIGARNPEDRYTIIVLVSRRDYLAQANGRTTAIATDLLLYRMVISDLDVLSSPLLIIPLHVQAFLSTLTFLLTPCPGRVCSIGRDIICMIF